MTVQNDYVPNKSPYQSMFCPNSSVEESVPYKTIVNYDDYLQERIFRSCSDSRLRQFKDLDDLKSFRLEHWKYLYSDSEILEFLKYDFLSLDQKLYRKMENNTHRAALIVHEVIYKALRSLYGVPNSQSSTWVTAFLFSDSDDDLIYRKLEEVGIHAIGSSVVLHWQFSLLLKAKTEAEISHILNEELIVRGIQYKLNDSIDIVACSSVRLTQYEFRLSSRLRSKTIGNCLFVQALVAKNKVLLNYVDSNFQVDRNLELYSSNKKGGWYPIRTAIDQEVLFIADSRKERESFAKRFAHYNKTLKSYGFAK